MAAVTSCEHTIQTTEKLYDVSIVLSVRLNYFCDLKRYGHLCQVKIPASFDNNNAYNNKVAYCYH